MLKDNSLLNDNHLLDDNHLLNDNPLFSENSFLNENPAPVTNPAPEENPAPVANPAPEENLAPVANPAPEENLAPVANPAPEENPAPAENPVEEVETVNVLFDKNPEEHYVKQGDPSKPTYYVIRRLPETTGLLARFRMVMGHVRYALSKSWIPVVDMQNYANPYLAPEKLGKENSWEYYFEQPMRIGLEQAYNGENVVLSNGDCVNPYPGHSLKFLDRKNDDLTEWRTLVKLGLLKVKPELMEEISATYERLFSPNDRVLGVILRGTDYLVRKIKGRPVPPPIDFAKSIVNAKLKDWECNKFFLATEDKKILEPFQKTFGYRCVILDREYVDYNSLKDRFVSNCRINRENDHYLQGKDYLTQIVLLSMCNSLVGARCSGNTTAMLLNEKYEHTYFFNVGRYGQLTLD